MWKWMLRFSAEPNLWMRVTAPVRADCCVKPGDWWEEMPDVHGGIRIYTSRSQGDGAESDWVEFRIRFTHGRVERIDRVE